jgi:alpha-galactosidase
MAGTFGYELDPYHMTAQERDLVKDQIKDYKRYASLIRGGRYYRLTNPFDHPVCAWSFVADDQSEVLLTAVFQEIHGNMTNTFIRFRGLQPGSIYQDDLTRQKYPADALMETGIPLPMPDGEYAAFTLHLKKIS